MTLEIVLVHIGTSIPSILTKNVAWLNHHFPKASLNLITDQITRPGDFPNVQLSMPQDNGVASKINVTPHSTEFRKGYWLHTIRRLGLLVDWHEQNPQAKLLHIESDMLLLPNFPFAELASVDDLMWPNVSLDSDSPALIYSPDSKTSRWLGEQILSHLSQDHTDMTVLRAIARDHPTQVRYFPSTPPGLETTNPPNVDADVVFFGGVFDGAGYGQWLGGQDPRNHWGITKRFMAAPEGRAVRPQNLNLNMSPDSRLLTVAKPGGVGFPLFSLHVHSKSLIFFSPTRSFRMMERLARIGAPGKPLTVFSIIGFLGSLKQFLHAGRNRMRKVLRR